MVLLVKMLVSIYMTLLQIFEHAVTGVAIFVQSDILLAAGAYPKT